MAFLKMRLVQKTGGLIPIGINIYENKIIELVYTYIKKLFWITTEGVHRFFR